MYPCKGLPWIGVQYPSKWFLLCSGAVVTLVKGRRLSRMQTISRTGIIGSPIGIHFAELFPKARPIRNRFDHHSSKDHV